MFPITTPGQKPPLTKQEPPKHSQASDRISTPNRKSSFKDIRGELAPTGRRANQRKEASPNLSIETTVELGGPSRDKEEVRKILRKQIESATKKSETEREAGNASEYNQQKSESETENKTRGKREISPGILKMRKIFETEETENREKDREQVSNVSKLKNSFESMMGKSREVYRQEELRERKRKERKNKREEVTRMRRVESRVEKFKKFEKNNEKVPLEKKDVSSNSSKRKITEECETGEREGGYS